MRSLSDENAKKIQKCTRADHMRNNAIRQDLGVHIIKEKINEYRKRGNKHVIRMEDARLRKIALNYRLQGGRLRKK